MIPEPGLPSRLSPGQVEREHPVGNGRSMKRAREPQMPDEIHDLAVKMFRAGKSITQVQAVVGMSWGVRTLGELKAMAGRGK